ncbi:unnamed protein product, partial [Ascophyllum nodosum]
SEEPSSFCLPLTSLCDLPLLFFVYFQNERVSETFRGWDAVVLAQLRYYYRSPSRSC